MSPHFFCGFKYWDGSYIQNGVNFVADSQYLTDFNGYPGLYPAAEIKHSIGSQGDNGFNFRSGL